ncbi:mitochondrial distribution and morphology protein 12 [Chaetomium tenue]|uniref:Mitochondrial distribution and morphology protein 12 n=1 Tax=Chaetomium tenue TaxID=1854479 RepID=A0ACB7PSR1_9PEZI|nr:mitochondrial distribution and morphology protein 12 [Chaetomium globosum]
MSIDLNWETVTGGPDGQELADQIRDFIHTKFQSVPLPRFIKSVTVHDFQFGVIPPELELKDITDPLPDFYEDHVDSDEASDDSEGEEDAVDNNLAPPVQGERHQRTDDSEALGGDVRNLGHLPPHLMFGGPGGPGGPGMGSLRNGDMGSPFMRVSTPGIPGGTSSLHYFHSHLAGGLSGTQTPLAAVAGAQHLSTANWLEGHGHSSSVPNLTHFGTLGGAGTSPRRQPERNHSRNPSQGSISVADLSPNNSLAPPSSSTLGVPSLKEKHSVSTLAPTSAGASRPPTRDKTTPAPPALSGSNEQQQQQTQDNDDDHPRLREQRIDDMQAVFRIRYAGDVKLLLTADILLDYPMPSFVGIPVRLSITGLTFDGVGVLAKIRKRVHFCFLSPEDAAAAVGADEEEGLSSPGEGPSQAQGQGQAQGSGQQKQQKKQPGWVGSGNTKLGGLLQEIRVESEIGQRESGRQSLKNVGKVERFVLEQVRRIFEEEFVYPSFWTFLV